MMCLAASGCSDTQPRSRIRGNLTAGSASPPKPNTPPAPNGGSLIIPSSSTAGRPAVGLDTEKICASAVVQTAKNNPTVVFVIDGSGSMCAPFGNGGTRWQSLRRALLDPMTGLIYRLQDAVRFGATLYDGTIDLLLALTAPMGSTAQNPPCSLNSAMGKEVGMCPLLLEAPAKPGNAMAIDTIFPARELGGSTPTDRAMSHVMDALIAAQKPQGPDDKPQGPVYVILATDGAPNDICVGGVGGDGSPQRQGVVAAVDRGAAAGIKTWVISLAGGDAALQAHLDEVAKHGDPKNANAHTFSPMNPDDLIMTLAQLLGGAIGCHIALSGSVMTGQECLGTVEQNGRALPCCQSTAPGMISCARTPTATPNGWRLTAPNSIELVGDACTNFLIGSGNLISASFPCAVFTPN